MYQLIRLSFGKATSRAPIISGIRKFPSVAGIEGTRKEEDHDDAVRRRTACCRSPVQHEVSCGSIKCNRISVADMPQTMNIRVRTARNISPIRLCTTVKSQERMP